MLEEKGSVHLVQENIRIKLPQLANVFLITMTTRSYRIATLPTFSRLLPQKIGSGFLVSAPCWKIRTENNFIILEFPLFFVFPVRVSSMQSTFIERGSSQGRRAPKEKAVLERAGHRAAFRVAFPAHPCADRVSMVLPSPRNHKADVQPADEVSGQPQRVRPICGFPELHGFPIR